MTYLDLLKAWKQYFHAFFGLLANEGLGKVREDVHDGVQDDYLHAFHNVNSDPNK